MPCYKNSQSSFLIKIRFFSFDWLAAKSLKC